LADGAPQKGEDEQAQQGEDEPDAVIEPERSRTPKHGDGQPSDEKKLKPET
jgi:hypothetical protein